MTQLRTPRQVVRRNNPPDRPTSPSATFQARSVGPGPSAAATAGTTENEKWALSPIPGASANGYLAHQAIRKLPIIDAAHVAKDGRLKWNPCPGKEVSVDDDDAGHRRKGRQTATKLRCNRTARTSDAEETIDAGRDRPFGMPKNLQWNWTETSCETPLSCIVMPYSKSAISIVRLLWVMRMNWV